MKKVAIVVSHPIQHFCPQYSSWSKLDGIELKVFFASKHGLEAYHDANFGKIVQWAGLKLDFNHEFLPGASNKKVNKYIDSLDVTTKLSEFDPDIIIAYGYIQPLQRRIINWAEKNQLTLLMIGDSELRQSRSWIRRMGKRIILPRLFAKVNYFLTVGDANEAYYRMYGVSDHKFIRTFFPIDTQLFNRAILKKESERRKIRRIFNIPYTHTVVLMVGKLVPWKRQIDLVGVSNLLQEKTSDVTVVLVGTGPDENKLKAGVIKQGPGGVIFAGFVAPEQLVSYYLASDIYVHCSEKEPHSLAISEAIYSGLPVLVSDRCGSYGPSDDVRHGLNGAVYPCGNRFVLAALIQKLAEDTELYERMSSESLLIGANNQRLAHGGAIVQAMNACLCERL